MNPADADTQWELLRGYANSDFRSTTMGAVPRFRKARRALRSVGSKARIT